VVGVRRGMPRLLQLRATGQGEARGGGEGSKGFGGRCETTRLRGVEATRGLCGRVRRDGQGSLGGGVVAIGLAEWDVPARHGWDGGGGDWEGRGYLCVWEGGG
jgi:hypothetical protein